MRILIAPDKFKGSLTASEAAQHITAGLREVLPDAQLTTVPIADGGEGTADVICSAGCCEWHVCAVRDPLGEQVSARYCTTHDGRTAVMEMSQAAGLWRVAERLRDPEVASSFGVGEMLLAAADRGVKRIIIGLGGSATNDGGFGMAGALGFGFFDSDGCEVGGAVGELLRLARITPPSRVLLPEITAAADVRNVLLGSSGATRTFGPQKGATPLQLDTLDLALNRLADVVARDLGLEARDVPGAGAAGGLGFGLIAFCGATIRSGFEVVAEQIGLRDAVQATDVVITGEGRLDAQTLQGKAPAGLARLSREYGKRIYAIVGEFEDAPGLRDLFDEIAVATDPRMTREAAIGSAPSLLRARARELGERLRQGECAAP